MTSILKLAGKQEKIDFLVAHGEVHPTSHPGWQSARGLTQEELNRRWTGPNSVAPEEAHNFEDTM